MIHNEEVDKSGDENLRVPMRDVSRVTESEVRMTTSGGSRTCWKTQGSRRFWSEG